MSSTPGNREVAHRVFAAEFDDAAFSYSESDEERAPNYVVMPTGARVNRLFAVGVLTEVAPAGESILRARVVDPTGAFVVYAGQYQPEAMAFLESAETPSFVAVTGKARTFEPEDSDVVYTSVRPESINEVDAATRDRWTATTAERTLDRVATMGAAIRMLAENPGLTPDALQDALVAQDVDASLAAGIPVALHEYDTGDAYLEGLQSVALDCLRQVAGDVDTVRDLDARPADADGSFAPVVDLGIDTHVDVEPVAPTDEPAGAPDESPAPADETAAAADEPSTSADEPTATSNDDAMNPTVESEATESTEPESGATGSDVAEPEPTAPTRDSAATEGSAAAPAERASETGGSDSIEQGDEPVEGGDEPAEEYEMDDETRREVEEEYGVEFETAAEVGEPGEADIETPDPDGPASEPTDDTAVEPEPEPQSEPEPEFEAEPDEASAREEDAEPAFDAVEPEPEEASTDARTDSEPVDEGTDEDAASAEDADVESVLLSRMEALDDGDGAPREELVESVSEATGATVARVEDAIQSLLMSGQCYEPDDDRFKPI